MGLFDYIQCRMPLPADPAPPDVEWFQTKFADDPYMERYTIEADGRLMHDKPRYDITPPDEVCGLIEVPFHGDLEFCELSDAREWWSYVARFTEGRCARIWCAEHRPPPSLVNGPSKGNGNG